MKLRPILFSTPMVLALLAGTKTQTRRIIKPQPIDDTENSGYVFSGDHESAYRNDIHHTPWQERFTVHSRYEVGDVLWVRETLYYDDHTPCWGYQAGNDELDCEYTGILARTDKVCIPSIHMPFIACRLFLELTAIRVERLQDITSNDAIAEGIERLPDWPEAPGYARYKLYGKIPLLPNQEAATFAPVDSYATLWENINGTGSWLANPFVWVYEFKQVDKPVQT